MKSMFDQYYFWIPRFLGSEKSVFDNNIRPEWACVEYKIFLWKYFLEIFWDLRKFYLTIISDQSGCALNTDENISD